MEDSTLSMKKREQIAKKHIRQTWNGEVTSVKRNWVESGNKEQKRYIVEGIAELPETQRSGKGTQIRGGIVYSTKTIYIEYHFVLQIDNYGTVVGCEKERVTPPSPKTETISYPYAEPYGEPKGIEGMIRDRLDQEKSNIINDAMNNIFREG